MTYRPFAKLALASAVTMVASLAQADLFHSVNGSISGSLCVGTSCVTTEIFTDDTLRMKDTRPRLHFEDTSLITSSFPSNDWRILINDIQAGGMNKFVINDADADQDPFVVEAGAPSNALYVSSNGNVGIGTSLPGSDLHVVSPSQARLRLEATGSVSDWRLNSSSTGLFFNERKDGLTSATAVFFSGAPSASLSIASTGNVGMGTSSPVAPLHVVENSGGAPIDMLRLENNGGVVFRLKDTSAGGQEFTFQSNGGIFRIASPAVPGPELTMDDFGNVTIKGEITTAGSCNAGCDRVFDAAYELKPLAQHNAMMWELGHLPNVGPTAEEGPMNLSQKMGGMLNELEHAHIYIGQLHDRLSAQEAELNALKKLVQQLQ